MRFLFNALFIFFSSVVAGQAVVTGSVIEQSSKQPVIFATIVLLRLPDSTRVGITTTDKKGRFTIDSVAPGNYFLQASFIGFEKLDVSPFIIEAGSSKHVIPTLEMVNTGRTLADVTVTGRRSMLNTGIDRKVYNVDQDIMSRSGSASDILKNIPSVEVDIDGNVSLRGSSDIMILINGKPSPLMGRTRAEVLQQLPANSIERIEVITNPSARYRPDGTSGILNIVLKKNIRNNFNGTSTLNAGNRKRINGNVILNYKPKKINFFGSYSFRKDSRKRFNDIDRTYLDSLGSPESFFKQNTISDAKPFTHIFNGGLDYTINKKNAVGLSGNYFSRKQVKNDISSTLRQDKLFRDVSKTSRLRDDPEYEKQKNLTGYFEHDFAKEDRNLRAEFDFSDEKELEDNHYTNIFYFPQAANTFDNTRISQDTRENQVTIDYSDPLTEDSKLEAGYDGLFNKVDLNFYIEKFDAIQHLFIKDQAKSNQFIYNENIQAVYATYQRGYEKFNYSVGLRSEMAVIKGRLITKDSLVSNNYFKIYPTLHLSYEFKKDHELQLNYSKRVHRPEADEINPFPEYQDSLNLRAGNPKLKPEIIHSVEFGYKWTSKNFSLIPSLYYRFKTNGFTNVIIPLNDSVLLSTIQNLSRDQSAGLEIICSVKAGKWFSSNISSNFFYNRIDAANLGYVKNKAIVSMSVNFNTNMVVTKTTIVQVSANYRSARLTPQGKSYPNFVMNAGMRQDLFKNKLSMTLTVSDIFNSLRQKSEYSIPELYQVTRSRRDGRIFYIGLSYRFGIVKKPKEEKLQFDNNL